MSTELSDLLEQHPGLVDAHVILLEDEENPVLEPLQTVYDELAQAKAHLAQVRSTMEALEQAGMYPAVPSEQWQGRNGGPKRYLYMLFGTNRRTGRYEGPNGKRKVYVGCKPDRIAEARRLAENRRRWEELERTAKVLDGWISAMESKVQSLAWRAGNWTQVMLRHWGRPPATGWPPTAPTGNGRIGAARRRRRARPRPQRERITHNTGGTEMYQRITIVGNLGGDPEMRYLPNGTPVANFSVATNRRWTGQDGQQQEETAWFRVSTFGRLAEVCNQYLSKGRPVLVEDRLRPDETGGPRVWQGNDGQHRASFEVTAQTVKFLGGRGDVGPSASDMEEPPAPEEEIPF